MCHYKLISFIDTKTEKEEKLTDVIWCDIQDKIEDMIHDVRIIPYLACEPNIRSRSKEKDIIIVTNIISSRFVVDGEETECRGCKMKMGDTNRTLCTSCESIDPRTCPVVISIERQQLASIIEGIITAVAWKKYKFTFQLVDYKFSNKREEQGAMRNNSDILMREEDTDMEKQRDPDENMKDD